MAASYPEPIVRTDSALQRVSWGAILVGIVIALVVQMLLGILGLAIGANIIDPLGDADPLDGIGLFAGIYWIISSVISLFAGGFAAGALTTLNNHRDRTLHGLTVWGLAMLLGFLMVGSGVGGLISGTASVIGGGVSMAGDALTSLAPQAADAVQRRMDEADIDLDLGDLREEARQLLRDTGARSVQPERLEEQGEELEQDMRSAAERVGQDPRRAEVELEDLFDRIQREGRQALRSVDREALVNVIVARTEQTRGEAEQTVSNWEQAYQQAYQRASEEWEQTKAQAEQQAREWGDQAADGIAKAAWWTFFMLLLGALAAAAGANVPNNRSSAGTRTTPRV